MRGRSAAGRRAGRRTDGVSACGEVLTWQAGPPHACAHTSPHIPACPHPHHRSSPGKPLTHEGEAAAGGHGGDAQVGQGAADDGLHLPAEEAGGGGPHRARLRQDRLQGPLQLQAQPAGRQVEGVGDGSGERGGQGCGAGSRAAACPGSPHACLCRSACADGGPTRCARLTSLLLILLLGMNCAYSKVRCGSQMMSSHTFLPRSSRMGRLQKSSSHTSARGTALLSAAGAASPAAASAWLATAAAAGGAPPSAAVRRHCRRRRLPPPLLPRLLLLLPLREGAAPGTPAAAGACWQPRLGPRQRGAGDRALDRPAAAARACIMDASV